MYHNSIYTTIYYALIIYISSLYYTMHSLYTYHYIRYYLLSLYTYHNSIYPHIYLYISPTLPPFPRQVRVIEASHSAFCALRLDGSVVTWGDPAAGGETCGDVQRQLKEVGPLDGPLEMGRYTWDLLYLVGGDWNIV